MQCCNLAKLSLYSFSSMKYLLFYKHKETFFSPTEDVKALVSYGKMNTYIGSIPYFHQPDAMFFWKISYFLVCHHWAHDYLDGILVYNRFDVITLWQELCQTHGHVASNPLTSNRRLILKFDVRLLNSLPRNIIHSRVLEELGIRYDIRESTILD